MYATVFAIQKVTQITHAFPVLTMVRWLNELIVKRVTKLTNLRMKK